VEPGTDSNRPIPAPTRRRRTAFFSIAVVIILISIGIYVYIQDQNRPHYRYYEYLVQISASGPVNYTVLVPVPVTSDNVIPDWMNDSQNTGTNYSYEYNETAYGPALKISSDSTFEYHARASYITHSSPNDDRGTKHPNGDIDYSMWVEDVTAKAGTLGMVWVYVNWSSGTGKLSIWMDLHINSVYHRTGSVSLTDGWNRIGIFVGGPAVP